MITRATLVYQGGIANVFQEERGVARVRLYQGDFHGAEMFARGLRAAGVKVRTMVCNKAGDIARETFSNNLYDAPFSDKFSPVGETAGFWD